MKRFMIILAVVAIGCTQEFQPMEKSSGGVECTFNLVPEAMSVTGEERTKSIVSNEMFSVITNVNTFAYKDGKLASSAYSEDGSSVKFVFPSRSDSYNLYFIANTGRVGAPQDEKAFSEMLVDLNRFASAQDCGFPMAGSQKSFVPGSATSFKLKRLVGAFSISMSSSATQAKYEILSVAVRNCAAQISPLGTKAATAAFIDGDVLTESQIMQLNAGNSVMVYATENLQGELIPGNTDPKAKIPANLTDSTLQNRCTYLELTSKITTASAIYDKVTYRIFLGSNESSDFNILRNTLYFLKLDFSTNLIHEEDWRIEAKYPEVVGEINLSKPSVSVIKGIDDIMYVTSTSTTSGESLDLVVSVDPVKAGKAGLTYTAYKTTYFGKEALAIRFSTSKQITSLLKWGDVPLTDELVVTLSSRDSFNGSPLVEAKFPVTVYRQAFPILIKGSARANGLWYLKAYSPNPLRLCFDVSTTITKADWAGREPLRFDSQFRRYLKSDSGQIGERGTVLSNEGVNLCLFDGGDGQKLSVAIVFTPVNDTSSDSDTQLFDAPFFAQGTNLYMGENSRAEIGPGMYPENETEFQEDYWLYMDVSQECSPNDREMFGSMYSEGGMVFTFSSEKSGWNCQDDYDVAKFEGRPFYFVNGGLYVYERQYLAEEPSWLNETFEYTLCYKAYEPRRDLGFVAVSNATFGARCRHMYQLFGHYHSWLEWRGYDYSVYLTFNGCSCWPGADISRNGFVE